MSPSLTPLTVTRLAYVRYLYAQGIAHSRLPTPLSASALLAFHDAVENLLGLAAEHLDVDLKPGVTFLGYWEAIKPKFDVPGKANMKRLNDARVALKHGGSFPSPQAIEQARETVIDFFRVVVLAVFDVDFDKIDMIDLIAIPSVATTLREAQTDADGGDIPMALAGLNVAFSQLLIHCTRLDIEGQSPFVFGGSLPMLSQRSLARYGSEPWASSMVEVKEQIKALRKMLPPVHRALQVISLGIDYPQYARFQVLTPVVDSFMDGHSSFQVTPWHRSLTAQDYESCRAFVIESALIAANAIAVLALHKTQNGTPLDGGVETRAWSGSSPWDV